MSRNLLIALVVVIIAGGLLGAYFLIPRASTNRTGSSSSTASITQTAKTLVAGSGSVTLTGQGTQATQITFAGSPGSFDSPVSGGHYSISLPAPATYSVSVKWTGEFSWQSGSVSLGQFSASGSSPSFTQDFQGSTPNSQAKVSGTATTSGSGTLPQQIVFVGSQSNFIASLTSGQYSVTVPNLATYKVLVSWVGAYSWQTGVISIVGFDVNTPAGSGSQTNNINLDTPNSVIQVSGNLQLTGSQTTASSMVFTLSGGQQQFNVPVSGGQYSVQLPDLATYSISISWSGAFPWQTGTDSSNSLTVNQPAGSTSQSSNIQVSTPNSWIQVSGHATTTASCTTANSVTFVGNGHQYQASVSGGTYSLQLPNLAQYTVSASWKGTYSWQTGSANANGVTINQGPGSPSQTADLSLATPECVITVTGTVSTTGAFTHPTQITFSANGQVYTAVPNGNSYSIQLPNLTIYTVSVNWISSVYGSGTCNPTSNTLNLNEPPGVSGITGSNWSC